MKVVCFASFLLVGIVAVPDARGQDDRNPILDKARSRLSAIYERGEFRVRRFRADWLPDGSGYTVSERDPGTNERVLVRYELGDEVFQVVVLQQETH